MDKFIPYEKLSKKQRRELNAQRREMWAISPVTRKPANPKAYNRQKTQKWINDDSHSVSSFFHKESPGCRVGLRARLPGSGKQSQSLLLLLSFRTHVLCGKGLFRSVPRAGRALVSVTIGHPEKYSFQGNRHRKSPAADLLTVSRKAVGLFISLAWK